MLKTRVIPTVTLRRGRLVKTRRFGPTRDVGDPLKTPTVYDAQLADELVFLDMDATREGRGVDRLETAIRQLAGSCFMPLTAGGGIREVEDIRRLVGAGADKVSVNSAALKRPALIRDAARRFGAQCIVVAIDAARVGAEYRVFTDGGTQLVDLDPVVWARQAADLGAGELLLTSIDRDGTMTGYDLELVGAVASAVQVPVIASGGAGKLVDFVLAVRHGAAAVAAASLFHFTDQSPIKAKAFMKREGIPVR